eukprot:20427-Heterococcus_DN1.PRE.1
MARTLPGIGPLLPAPRTSSRKRSRRSSDPPPPPQVVLKTTTKYLAYLRHTYSVSEWKQHDLLLRPTCDYFDEDEFGGGGDAFDADSGYQDYRRQQDYGGY